MGAKSLSIGGRVMCWSLCSRTWKRSIRLTLMKSEYGELAAFLTNTTGTTHFIFTPVQRAAFLNRLEPKSFSEEAMRQYFNEFNATNQQEIGRAMLDGVSALHESLGQIENSFRSGFQHLLRINDRNC